MPIMRLVLCWLAVVLVGLPGCHPANREPIKRPPYQEEFISPPKGDVRFDRPVEYPKGTLFADEIKPDQPNNPANNGLKAPQRFNPTGMR